MDEQQIDAILGALTLAERVALLAGDTFWATAPIPRLGVPAIKVTDGPNGARGGGSLVGGVRAASFPVGIALAATWDTALVREVGAALAGEARSKGARVLLGPTVNLHRSPLNGRNFECYSEDPHLAARIAVAYIAGLQGGGVAATVKHFAGNESEYQRMTIDSQIDERPLRELYLVPFEAAVREAGTWAIMCAYNRLNGTYASEHPRLVLDILRGEWGFDGLMMSDWFATHSTAPAANAGLDLEMPGPTRHRGEALVAAVRAGEVPEAAVTESARRVLRLIGRVGAFADPAIPEERAIDRPEDRALIRRAGAAGTVLLKNDGLLPLDPAALTSVAVIGPNAAVAQIMGGGSAQLNAHYRVSPLDGLAAQLGPGVRLDHEPGCTNDKLLPLLRGPVAIEYFADRDFAAAPAHRAAQDDAEVMWLTPPAPGLDKATFAARLTASFTPAADGDYHFGLISAGLSRLFVDGQLVVDNWDDWWPGDSYFGAGSAEVTGTRALQSGRAYAVTIEYASAGDSNLGIRAVRTGVALPLGDDAIERAARLAAGADVALVFAGLTGEWDSEGADRPHMDLTGRQDELIARVAAANPRTAVVLQSGGPLTMPWLERVAAVLQAWYPGQEAGNAIADVLLGAAEPGGRLPQTFPARLRDNPAYLNYPGENGRVRYGEGLFIGYRYYERKGIAPLFPFGFGLAYTTFVYGDLRLKAATLAPGDTLTATIAVTNTGPRPGQEVVQGYVRDPHATLLRPEQELRAFARLTLAPGETATATLALDMRALAYYDDARAAWVAEAGDYELRVGSSSRDIHARASFTLSADWLEPVGPQTATVSAG